MGKAIADFDAALKINAKLAYSLYGRGLAKNRMQSGSGDQDIAAATAISPDVAKDYVTHGIN